MKKFLKNKFFLIIIGILSVATFYYIKPIHLVSGLMYRTIESARYTYFRGQTLPLSLEKKIKNEAQEQRKNIIVQKGEKSKLKAVIPEEIAQAKENIPEPILPPTQVKAPPTSKDKSSLGVLEQQPPNRIAPVPRGIVDQKALARDSQASDQPVIIKWARKRYLFRNLSLSALETNGTEDKGGSEGPFANIDINSFSPQGEMIEAALVNSAFSSNTDVDVVGAVWLPFYFQGNLLLEPGDRLIGTSAGGTALRDRMMVHIDKIIFKDGRSLPIQGVALHTDGTEGIKGYRVSEYGKQLLGPILAAMGQAFLYAMEYQSFNYYMSPYGLTPWGLYGQPAYNGAKQAMMMGGMYAGTNAMQQIMNILAQDIEQYKPYVFVPAGTRFRVFLKSYMDISKADYGR
ncbi:type IV secretory pathway, VirB10 protein [Methylacidiphilum kamchatkense Kam1]|uniref:Type IV secretion system protein VirB10 n=1 Tax=Methylacidiphilum kamchatkense Kam1 TaxID=1202785 RepID=A0A0C1UQ48_9BACT|nr:DotG/IcmE/VirB10 family protein [Methylacidiphilum kamchatkense]KIE57973.1 type IV secretory pathway, VirB10 protein [Methylacidiphilum kamchatkense Kam1]QDQ42406.1 type IV secretion system protein VirB10 [Methylacidiphilum kamchatkense Kam1]